jgi:hypothetical protein
MDPDVERLYRSLRIVCWVFVLVGILVVCHRIIWFVKTCLR